jgi:AhpD family alkylhydroperoxidase
MDERTKELIAIGASAAVNCHPCIDLHLSVCDSLGIGRDEAAAAIEVGLAVNRGAAAKTRLKVTALLGTAGEAEGGSGDSRCC